MHNKQQVIIGLIVIAVIGIPAILSLSNQQQKLRASAQTPPSTTYYVSPAGNDSNPGTEASPWKTIQKAASTMVGGDTVLVNSGTYNEKVNTVRSGTSGSRITFKANPGAKLQTFLNINHNYITIDGFEMTGANEGYMMTWNGSFGELLNNKIHDTGASSGIVRGDGDNLTIRGNHYYSSTGPGDDLAIFIIGGNNSLAENNEVGPGKDVDAFRVWGTNNIIRANYIHDLSLSSGSSSHQDVIQTFGLGGATSNNIVFENNRIDNTNGNGLQMFMTEANGSANMRDWDFRNNIFIGVSGQANLGIPNIRFYNNTVYNSGAGNNLIMYLYDASGKSNYSGAQIKNNIFVTPSGIGSYGQVLSVGNSGSNVQISNNFITRINTWGTLSGFSDSNGINGGNPEFVNATANDFHLLPGSPAIDRGATLPGFNYDYAYATRPQGSAWDIGVFEFGAITPSPSSSPSASITPLSTPTSTPTSIPLPTETITQIPTPTPTPTFVPLPTATPTSIPTSTPVPSGNGLSGSYFPNRTFSGSPTLTRIDPAINFIWTTSAPALSLPANNFSVRWTGYVIPKYSQQYTFYTQSDDGVRLWVNGIRIVNNWTDHASTENSGKINLTAGKKYTIALEYYEKQGNAVIQLRWSSPSQPKGIIPPSQLYSN